MLGRFGIVEDRARFARLLGAPSKSSGRKKGKAAVQESEDEKTSRLEREEFETQMELQRLRGEQLRLKRKMLGKRDLGEICKSPLAKFLMLQLGLCLLYYVFVELRPKAEDYKYEFESLR